MFKKIINKVKEYTLPILVFTAILVFLVYYGFKLLDPGYFKKNETNFKELFAFGLTALSSGIFLAVLKWMQFMKFFEEELQKIISSSEFDEKIEKTVHDVVYSDEYMKKQSEQSLVELWSRVNKAMFNNQFPEAISKQVEKGMHDTFLHNSKLSHYYKRFIYRLNINLDSEDFLSIHINTETKIVRPDTSAFNYDFCYYSLKTNADDQKTATDITEVKIDGIRQEDQKITVTANNEERIERKFETKLKDKTEYDLYNDITLVYNIGRDYEFALASERFIDDLRVEIAHSSNLKIIFLPIGNERFEDVPDASKIIKTYDKTLFPEKGFRIIFIKK